MLDRMKRVIVESFIGAIALGYLFAQAILHFVNVFAAPVEVWATRTFYQGLLPGTIPSARFPLQAALPQLVSFVVLLVVWYVLVRWLYFKPRIERTSEQSPEQAA